MAGTNQFYPFATDSSANIMSLTDYYALTQRPTGFQSGNARSAQCNRVWRQSSVMASALGQWMANRGVNALDDGSVANLTASIESATDAMLTLNLSAGSTTTLDATTQANFPMLQITGYLNVTTYLVVPATPGRWVILNDSTGSSSLFVKTASGTGAVATRGQATTLVCDGTNVRRLSAGDSVPPGAISATVRTTSDDGYLLCDGTAISRTTYADLFSVCGTTFGVGDGSSTFALPDLRGYFIRGYDAGRRVDPDRVFGTTQDDALQDMYGELHYITGGSAATGVFGIVAGSTNHISGDYLGTDAVYAFDAANVARTANETRPKNIALNYQIKY